MTGASLTSELQAGAASWIQDRLAPVVAFLEPVPDWLAAAGLIGFAVLAVTISGRKRRTEPDREPERADDQEGHCHGPAGIDEADGAGAVRAG